jgi:hypothetical protein
VTQKDLPQLMRVGEPVGEDGEVCDARLRKMDAKSLFHYMKTLKAAGVIKIKPLAFSKKDAPSSGAPQNVQTNLVCLARFEAEVPPEGGAFLVETDESESRYVAEAIKVMLRAKDGLVRTTELKKLVTGAKAGARFDRSHPFSFVPPIPPSLPFHPPIHPSISHLLLFPHSMPLPTFPPSPSLFCHYICPGPSPSPLSIQTRKRPS